MIDNGQAGGLGLLTGHAASGASAAAWGVAALDGVDRVAGEQNSLLHRSAWGLAAGAGSVSATLDGRPLNVLFDGQLGPGQWRADMDLGPGAHTLAVAAADPSGLYHGAATNVFNSATNSGDRVTDTYDADGNVTQRVWVTAGGQTNRTQTLTWDAFNRLVSLTDRDAFANGSDWTAVYDAFGRRLQTACAVVLTNREVEFLNSSNAVNVVQSWYDPEVEFLEVGVMVDGWFSMKTYGPDINGRHGGMQGVGGVERVSTWGHTTITGTIQDYFGNVLATVTNGTVVSWNPARFNSYGPVDGYQPPVSLSSEEGLAQSMGWRGKRVDETGLIYLGARLYDPVAGRFISGDPLGHGASQDLYSFCGGDPVNSFDPDGRCWDTARNFAYGGIEGTVQGYFGTYVSPPVNEAEYYGQMLGRDMAAVASTFALLHGLADIGSGGATALLSIGVGVASDGTLIFIAGPGLAIGAVQTGVGVLETAAGAYGLYNWSQLTPLQQPSAQPQGSSDSSAGSSTTPNPPPPENASVPRPEGNIPDAVKWIANGGTVTYGPDSITYTLSDGTAITYNSRGFS